MAMGKADAMDGPLLRRFWFQCAPDQCWIGFGVTAFTCSEAEQIVGDYCDRLGRKPEITSVIEDVDIRTLDQKHVVPNMGPCNLPGLWYPRENL